LIGFNDSNGFYDFYGFYVECNLVFSMAFIAELSLAFAELRNHVSAIVAVQNI
jgi:hypothetical protein